MIGIAMDSSDPRGMIMLFKDIFRTFFICHGNSWKEDIL